MFKNLAFGAIAATTLALGVAGAASATVILSADSNIFSPIDGSSAAPIDPNNTTFALNVLGGASDVLVQGPDSGDIEPPVNALQTLYAGQGGVTSTLVSTTTMLEAADFVGLDLFVAIVPDTYTNAETALISDFLTSGGTVFLVGENDDFFSGANSAINALLSDLGSGMSLNNNTIDAGFQVGAGAVSADPLTAGVSALTYAFTNSIDGGTSLATTRGGQTLIAVEAGGDVPPIPLPAPIALLGVALLGLGALRRKT